MEIQIIQLVKDLSYPALIVIALLIFQKAGFWSLLADFLRGKINGNTDKTTSEKLDLISGNHLHEIKNILLRIDDKLEKTHDNIIYIKAKMNGK